MDRRRIRSAALASSSALMIAALALPAPAGARSLNGSFAQPMGSPRIYWNHDGTWHAISSPQLFRAMGGSPARILHLIKVGPVGKPVAFIRKIGSPTVYHIVNDVLEPLTSAQALRTQGYSMADVAPVRTLPFPVGAAFSAKAHLTVLGSLLAGQTQTLSFTSEHVSRPVYQLIWETPQGQRISSGAYTGRTTLDWTPAAAGNYQLVLHVKSAADPPRKPYVTTATATVTVRPLTVGYGNFSLTGTTPGTSLYDLEHHADQLSTIAPLWYQASVTGTLTTQASPDQIGTVVQDAASQHVAVWPTVTLNQTLPSGWASSAAASQLISSLVQEAEAEHYQGYTLDFENIGPQSGQTYADFVAQLATALHHRGLTLMVSVLPLPDAQYPYAALAKHADYLDLLAYPEYTVSTPSTEPPAPNPGPTAGLPWVAAAVKSALQAAPSSHLVLGISPYGQSWTYTNGGFQSGIAIPDRTIEQSLENQPGQSVFDPVQAELEISTGSPAIAPPAPLTPAPNTFNPAVQNLQFLLSAILLRYDLASPHDITPAAPLATDGGYGPATENAVKAFQQDFQVSTSTPGIYDGATQAALTQAITQYNLGDTISWDENPKASGLIMNMARQEGLSGVSIWRLGYQAPSFWAVLGKTCISHPSLAQPE